MQNADILNRLQEVFAKVFDDEAIMITENTTAADVEGWDSLAHITLIAAVESAFSAKFSLRDILGMKNVGDMVALLARTSK